MFRKTRKFLKRLRNVFALLAICAFCAFALHLGGRIAHLMQRGRSRHRSHISSPAGSKTKDILKPFYSRRLSMLQECRKDQKSAHDKIPQEVLQRLLYDDNLNLIVCAIPGAANTNWRKLFIYLSGRTNYSRPSAISGDAVYQVGAPNLASLSQTEAQQRLRDYTKVIFPRDPLERLVSVYMLLFYEQNKYFSEFYGSKMIKEFREDATEGEIKEARDVSFEEFIRYISTDKTMGDVNDHWSTQYEVCSPCGVQYNFIGQLEHVDEELSAIWKHLFIDQNAHLPKQNYYNKIKTSEMMLDMYSSLPDDLMKQLLDVYGKDYKYFGISSPKIL